MEEKKLEQVRIIGLPKGSVLWPTAFVALLGGLIGLIAPSLLGIFSGIFFIVFTFNLVVLFFDFSRGSILGIAGLIIAFVVFVISFQISILQPFIKFVESGIFEVSAQFLFLFGLIFMVLFFIAIVVRKNFEYFVISSNEIVRKEGFLGDASRYNATDIQIDKTITDVFESLLLFGAGDLIIKTPRGKEFHILNVPRINRREMEIRKLLGKLEVDTT